MQWKALNYQRGCRKFPLFLCCDADATLKQILFRVPGLILFIFLICHARRGKERPPSPCGSYHIACISLEPFRKGEEGVQILRLLFLQ